MYLLYALYVRCVPLIRFGIRLVRSKWTDGFKWTYNYLLFWAKSGMFVLHRTFICKHHMTATFHHMTATLIGPQRMPPMPRTTSTTLNPVQTLRLLWIVRFTRTICTFCTMAVLSVLFVRFLYVLYLRPNVQNAWSKWSMERGCYLNNFWLLA